MPGHPAPRLPYLDQTDHLQALCAIPPGLQLLEDGVDHLWTSWELLVPRTRGWISAPPRWDWGLLGDPRAQHCTVVLSPLPATCPLCPHLPDDTLEGQLCPRATGVPQQQGHAVAKGNQCQLGSCQLQDLLLEGETYPAGQGQHGTAMAATAWHGQHAADGPGSSAWGQGRAWGSQYLSCIQVENTIDSQGALLVRGRGIMFSFPLAQHDQGRAKEALGTLGGRWQGWHRGPGMARGEERPPEHTGMEMAGVVQKDWHRQW